MYRHLKGFVPEDRLSRLMRAEGDSASAGFALLTSGRTSLYRYERK